MIKLQEKIINAYLDLDTSEDEEKVILSVVAKIDKKTLKTETCLIVQGNKLSSVKILRELLKDSRANDLSLILEEIKDYL